MEAIPVTKIKIGGHQDRGPLDYTRLKTRRRGNLVLGIPIALLSILMILYLSWLGPEPVPGINYLPLVIIGYIGAMLIGFGIRAHIQLTRIVGKNKKKS